MRCVPVECNAMSTTDCRISSAPLFLCVYPRHSPGAASPKRCMQPHTNSWRCKKWSRVRRKGQTVGSGWEQQSQVLVCQHSLLSDLLAEPGPPSPPLLNFAPRFTLTSSAARIYRMQEAQCVSASSDFAARGPAWRLQPGAIYLLWVPIPRASRSTFTPAITGILSHF